ncbi:MAG: methyltransferase domain-containing protein [Alphaproteobacteria bacterium]|nr:methyltransferase domain-containing protein [Alphaproteobacteria bacterium]
MPRKPHQREGGRAVPSPRPAAVLAAEAWAEVREPLDRQLSPLGLRAIEALCPRAGEMIVDIGCGAGQTVLQLADRVGPEGHVIGVDIAPLLLDIARERARGLTQVSFIEGDAAVLDLPAASVDAFFSRFGVMALSDHAAAFANFHRMLKPDGRLAFVCWRSLDENELDHLPLRAAGHEHRLDPTPFSFEDPAYVRAILEKAGFREVGISAHDEAVTSGDLDAMTTVLLKVGPLGRIIRENPELRAAAEPPVRAALAAKGGAGRVTLRAAIWVVSARA